MAQMVAERDGWTSANGAGNRSIGDFLSGKTDMATQLLRKWLFTLPTGCRFNPTANRGRVGCLAKEASHRGEPVSESALVERHFATLLFYNPQGDFASLNIEG